MWGFLGNTAFGNINIARIEWEVVALHATEESVRPSVHKRPSALSCKTELYARLASPSRTRDIDFCLPRGPWSVGNPKGIPSCLQLMSSSPTITKESLLHYLIIVKMSLQPLPQSSPSYPILPLWGLDESPYNITYDKRFLNPRYFESSLG